MGDPGVSAPTGCYKCGRPGHWSRDCPSSGPSSTQSNPNYNSSSIPNPVASNSTYSASSRGFGSSNRSSTNPVGKTSAEKPKKIPKTRPKLTPELLLSDQGLGYILRYFPRNFKYRGRGHEVEDLQKLLRLYTEWHSQLMPYYPFDQFVQKVEQVGSAKRVRLCLKDLRERVANGGDPSKLNEPPEPPLEHETLSNKGDPMNSEEASSEKNKSSSPHVDNDELQDILNDVYSKTVGEPSQALDSDVAAAGTSSGHTSSQIEEDRAPDLSARSVNIMQITEEQRARMEANKLKALKRAAARA